jgi:hypothetical protein
LLCELLRVGPSAAECEQARLGDTDDLVADERLELDALVGLGLADERELHTAFQEPIEDLAAGGDLDLDDDVGVVTAEATERVGQQVDARSRGGANVDRPGLEPREQAKLFLACLERLQRLTGVEGQELAGLGERATAAVALDQPLPRRALERAEVLARGRLADPDRAGGGGNAALTADFNQQAQAGGVPDERESAIGQSDSSHRNIRLAHGIAPFIR